MSVIYNDEDFMSIEELRTEVGWPLDYTTSKTLIPYIKRLKGDDVSGVEIGTGRGEGTYLILETCPNVSMDTIDPFLEYEDWIGTIMQADQDKFKAIARKNLTDFHGRATMINLKSDEAVNGYEDNSLDFVIIDGDHSSEQVARDCKNYYSKLRSGGLFAVHDNNLHGVKDGLKKFREENKIRVPLNMASVSMVFWYKA